MSAIADFLPDFRLDGRRALVTGAGRGIGEAAAVALAMAGAETTLLARSASDLQRIADAIHAAGGRAKVLPLDVTDHAALQGALADMPSFDILVNSAGTNRPGPFPEVSEEDYDTVMGLNVKAAFFASQSVARGMIRAGRGGSIIQISSQMGHVGGALRSVYCASKWAVEGMTRAMAVDLATYGIRVNTLAPTFVETAMTRVSLGDPQYRQHIFSKIKLGRLAQPRDLTGAVIFLASSAGAMMTGSSIVIDGGWIAD